VTEVPLLGVVGSEAVLYDVGAAAMATGDCFGKHANIIAQLIYHSSLVHYLYKKVTGKCAPPLYDAVAVAAVVEPEILEKRCVRVEIECKGEFTRGETVCDLRGVWEKPANAEVSLDLDKPAFFEILHRWLKESSG
jgi:inosine-uridine nucleoside N-ribohydrolase